MTLPVAPEGERKRRKGMSIETPESLLIKEVWERAEAHYKPMIAKLTASLKEAEDAYASVVLSFDDAADRAEAAEKDRDEARGQVCKVREWCNKRGFDYPTNMNKVVPAVQKLIDESSPCAHAARVRELEGAIKWACRELKKEKAMNPETRWADEDAQFADEIMRRGGLV